MAGDPGLAAFRRRILHVEQPFPRSIALAEPLVSNLIGWEGRPPTIIDESDGEISAFPRALSSGYSGTSYKSCKGVFRGLASAALARKTGAIHSAEDLAGVGPVAMLQDTAVVAALGLGHAERNGHHYFRGLTMFPQSVKTAMMEHHRGFYDADATGFAALRIENGSVDLATINAAPFGCAPLVDLDPYAEIARYS
jgi:hypothetical protein